MERMKWKDRKKVAEEKVGLYAFPHAGVPSRKLLDVRAILPVYIYIYI
jgi:hypothetical protein